MKQLFTVIAFLALLLPVSAKYIPATVIYSDGNQRNGIAKQLKGYSDEFIFFKETEDSEVEKIPSSSLKTIIIRANENEYKEYDWLCPKRMTNKKKIKLGEPKWIPVLKRGVVTLYGYTSEGFVIETSLTTSVWTSDNFYYVYREGEDGAMWIHYEMGGTDNNAMFQFVAQDYFADYPELAEKIKKEEYTYKDMVTVFEIYAKWKKQVIEN